MTDPRLWEPGQSAGGTPSQECDPRQRANRKRFCDLPGLSGGRVPWADRAPGQPHTWRWLQSWSIGAWPPRLRVACHPGRRGSSEQGPGACWARIQREGQETGVLGRGDLKTIEEQGERRLRSFIHSLIQLTNIYGVLLSARLSARPWVERSRQDPSFTRAEFLPSWGSGIMGWGIQYPPPKSK